MKTITTLLFALLIPIYSFCQLIDELPRDEAGNLNFNEVIKVDSASKEELFLRARQFFAESFKSSNDVIQLQDKDAGLIIGKGMELVYINSGLSTLKTRMYYTIKIQSKDGRFKYEIYDISFKSYAAGMVPENITDPMKLFDKAEYFKSNGNPRNIPEKYKIEMVRVASSLTTLIKRAMLTSITSSGSKNNW